MKTLWILAAAATFAACHNRNEDTGAAPNRGDTTMVKTDTTMNPSKAKTGYDTTAAPTAPTTPSPSVDTSKVQPTTPPSTGADTTKMTPPSAGYDTTSKAAPTTPPSPSTSTDTTMSPSGKTDSSSTQR